MKVTTYDDPGVFWSVVGDWLHRDPVRNTILITTLRQLIDVGPSPGSDGPPLLLAVHDNDDLIGVALHLPPRPLVVTGLPERAHGIVIDLLGPIAGISGAVDVAEPFMAAFLARGGQEISETIPLRLYSLGDLLVPDVPGTLRLGTADDVEFLATWWEAFVADVGLPERPGNGAALVQQGLDFGRALGIWSVAGEPVAMAFASPAVAGMSRIGPVYTPPEQRGRGYAKAVTAHISQHARDRGADHVLLFAETDNPASNAAYLGIGFVAEHDAVEYVLAGRNTLGS